MEWFEIVQSFISNCGFPIAAFLLMWWQNNKTSKSLDSLADKIEQLIIKNDKM